MAHWRSLTTHKKKNQSQPKFRIRLPIISPESVHPFSFTVFRVHRTIQPCCILVLIERALFKPPLFAASQTSTHSILESVESGRWRSLVYHTNIKRNVMLMDFHNSCEFTRCTWIHSATFSHWLHHFHRTLWSGTQDGSSEKGYQLWLYLDVV